MPHDADRRAEFLGRDRWPMAAAVVVVIVLSVVLPGGLRLAPLWVVILVEGLLLVAVVAAAAASGSRPSARVWALSLALVAVLVLSALWATVFLVADLIAGGPETNSANDLLAVGGAVWLSNNLAFALLYWKLDGGGPAARTAGPRPHPDMAFPQHMNPHLAPPGWRPRFVDYLYLGVTNSLAFSPTDVMPLAAWAKLSMAAQSLVSLAILGLVIARAVNLLA